MNGALKRSTSRDKTSVRMHKNVKGIFMHAYTMDNTLEYAMDNAPGYMLNKVVKYTMDDASGCMIDNALMVHDG